MLPQAASLAVRPGAPRAIVIHTATATFARQAAADAWAAGLDNPTRSAKARYARLGLPFFGHVLVGSRGDVEWLAPPDRIAYHARDLDRRYDDAGWREWGKPWDGGWARHGRDPAEVWDWWDERWSIETPLSLPTGRSPNAAAIGIDLLPLPTSGRHDEYTARQVRAAADMIAQLCRAFDIPRTRGYVLAHEDIDPCRRGIVRGRDGRLYGRPWDPGPRLDWAALGLEV